MRRRRSPISLLALASIVSISTAIGTPQPIPLPQLDFEHLGDVLLAGNFLGVSLLDYPGRETVLEAPNIKDEIILQTGNDTYVSSELTDGSIAATCMLGDNHTAIIAGNFTKVLNETAPGLAKLDLSNMAASSLGENAPQGVNTLWCNGTEVYVGGSFEYGGSYAVAIWNSLNNTWSNPAFMGFVKGSTVNTIIPMGNNIVFGGTMKGLMPFRHANTSNVNSSELLKPGMQPFSFNFANATAFGSQSSSGRAIPGLLCPYSDEEDSNGWEADLDSTTGFVNISLGANTALPTRIRIFNLPDGSGTKTFRIITDPANGIMNLTYKNASDKLQSCSAYCPLPESNSTIEYHDFEFVNVVPTNSLQIELLDFYGSRAGLKGIQLFQEGQYAYANEQYNLPRNCGPEHDNAASHGSQSASSTLEGNWSPVSDYMVTNITDKAAFSSTFAKLTPFFNGYTVDRGHYVVQLWTPGCEADNVCSQRGQVNVSVYPGFGSPQSTILYQTNDLAKYDLVYNGTLQDGAYIQISPTSQNQLPMQLVAYKANLLYVGPPSDTNTSVLFEYSPANFSSKSSAPVGQTAINTLGEQMGENASVNALLSNGTTSLLVGGSSFATNLSSSLLSLPLSGSANETIGVSGIDVTDSILKLYSMNDTILALSANDTYNVSRNISASSLGIGASSTVAPFDLDGINYLAFSHLEEKASGLSLWNPTNGFASSSTAQRVQGHIDAAYDLTNATTAYFGSLEIVDTISFGGGARIGGRNLMQPMALPFSFSVSPESGAKSQLSEMHGRDDSTNKGSLDQSSRSNAVYTGVYINSTHNFLAGHFNATVSNNRSATNVLILSEDKAEPLTLPSGDTIDVNSSFYAATALNATVALGGEVTGNIDGNSIEGLILYNGSSPNPFANQPPALSRNMVVSALVFKPNTSELLVGGQFSNTRHVANSSCNGICGYDTENKKWYGPKSLELGNGATVADLVFETGDRLVLGGNFTIGNSDETVQVAVYEFSNNTLEPLSQLPGPVKSLVVLSNSTKGSIYAVSGQKMTNGQTSPYLKWYNGTDKTWHEFEGLNLQPGSIISGISLVALHNNTGNTNGPLRGNQGLLVSGELLLSNKTQASVAIYNGIKLQGVYATTYETLSSGSSEGQNGTSQASNGIISTVYSQYGGNLKGGVVFNEGTPTSHPKPSQSPKPPSGTTKEGHLMPAGHVVGIACGIGIGCVMVLTLLYFAVEFLFNIVDARIPYQNLAQSRPTSDPMSGTKVL